MIAVRRRRLAAAALVAVSTLTLGACGTGFSAQTNEQYQPAIGANLRTGPVQLLNALFVDNGDGTATFSGGLLNETKQVQQLHSVSITRGSGATVKVTPALPVSLVASKLLTLGPDGEVIVAGDNAIAGGYVTVAFDFEGAGEVSTQIPVVTRTSLYDTVAKTPVTGLPTTPTPTP